MRERAVAVGNVDILRGDLNGDLSHRLFEVSPQPSLEIEASSVDHGVAGLDCMAARCKRSEHKAKTDPCARPGLYRLARNGSQTSRRADRLAGLVRGADLD